MDNQKEFAVSVADALGFDPDTDELLFKAKTLISSSFKESVSNKEVTGGYAAAVQYEFDYGKKVEADIEDCQFKEAFLALANGNLIVSETQAFFAYDEEVTITGGTGTLANTPIGNVIVESEDGTTLTTVTPTVKAIAVAVPDGTVVNCTYQYNTSIDSVTIDGDHYGKTIKLVLIAKVFKPEGLCKELQITIPKFKIKGEMNLDFKDDGVSTTKLSGQALAYGSKDVYAKIQMKRVDGEAVPIQQIAVTEPEIALNSTTATTKLISTIGIRGGVYGNVNVPLSDLTLSSSSTAVCSINGTTKAITYVGAGTATVTVQLTADSSVKDIINVTCTV